MTGAWTLDVRSTNLTELNRAQEPNPILSERIGSARLPLSGSGNVPQESRRLLFLDDDPTRAQAFLMENPEAVWVQTASECQSRLSEPWDEVHLDHDLGGKQFVDPRAIDCGMEVIRWLCEEPRPHLRQTFFCIHTHNTLAGLLMVLHLRERGYNAEFRPFGVDLAQMLLRDEPTDCASARLSTWERWWEWLRSFWRAR
jgi:hypothetical protein